MKMFKWLMFIMFHMFIIPFIIMKWLFKLMVKACIYIFGIIGLYKWLDR